MLLKSPPNLHYPITVTEILKRRNEEVAKFEPLFSYSYKSVVTEGNKYGEEHMVEKTFPTRFESETEGVLTSWKIKKGAVIDKAGVALIEIEEPCTHDVQFGGLCANCGKDMTEVDYGATKPDSTRANINMSHGNTALRVSEKEAARVELDAKKRLLESRKLSLVVDLDQTIIHATTDLTVSEWMKDPSNPNYEAVKDVQAFQLLEDGPGRGYWYFIKMRPGLRKFLEDISKLFELHIYTMGTRAYATHVTNIIDPERKIFGDRILSRDENGSLTAKSLQRLFPIDTKMVLIIDDRGDVWSWSHNLVKVRPYEFFVGIGDINSSFLPKREELNADDPPLPTPEVNLNSDAPTAESATNEPERADEAQPTPVIQDQNSIEQPRINGESSILEKLVEMSGSDDSKSMKEKSQEQDETLAAQLADKPLLQKQKMLEQAEDEANEQMNNAQQNNENSYPVAQSEIQKPRHNLLQDDDTELQRLEDVLTNVHQQFYETFRKNAAGSMGGRVAELRGNTVSPSKKKPEEELHFLPDVQQIMPYMKMQVLKSCTLVFSAIIPLGIAARRADIGRWAETFGATIHNDVTSLTTHVIAPRNRKTAKVKQAAQRPDQVKIVTAAWLFECFSQWAHVDETPFVIDVEPERDVDGNLISRAEDHSSRNGLSSPPSLQPSPFDNFEDGTLSDEDNNDGPSTFHKENNGSFAVGRPNLSLNTSGPHPKPGAFDPVTAPPDLSTNALNFSLEVNGVDMAKDGEGEDMEEPHSPIDDVEDDEWDDMAAEFEDLDDDDSESQRSNDTDSEIGTSRVNNSESTGESGMYVKRKRGTDTDEESASESENDGLSSQSRKKRVKNGGGIEFARGTKRKNPHNSLRSDTNGEEESDESSIPAVHTSDAQDGLGSQLQRKKRKALERTSSLNNVHTISPDDFSRGTDTNGEAEAGAGDDRFSSASKTLETADGGERRSKEQYASTKEGNVEGDGDGKHHPRQEEKEYDEEDEDEDDGFDDALWDAELGKGDFDEEFADTMNDITPAMTVDVTKDEANLDGLDEDLDLDPNDLFGEGNDVITKTEETTIEEEVRDDDGG